MKLRTGLTMCGLVLSSFSAALLPVTRSVTAQTNTAPATLRSASIDLDGDGKLEKIAVSGTKDTPLRFVLSINNTTRTEKDYSFDSDLPPGFRVVKIDRKSKTQQIAVEFMQPSGLAPTCFYQWDGKTIRRIGVVENVEEITGNGAIDGSIYMGFWSCKQKYVLDPKTQMLRLVRQPTYSVDLPATVTASFPVRQNHADKSDVVATTAPGSKIQLVKFWSPAADPGDSTEANSWFLIKTANGLSGWTRLTIFKEKVDGLVYGG